MDTPASAPNMAERGNHFRTCNPIPTPKISINPSTAAQIKPADHAKVASLVVQYTGPITEKTIKNMWGTLEPEGRAVTSFLPVFLASLYAIKE